MDPWSKVELLTHHPGGGHGYIEASGMVFFLRHGARTGTTISSRERNRDGGRIEVGIEKRVSSWGFPRPGIHIGQRGSQGVAPRLKVPGWRRPHPGHARWAPCPLVALLRLFFVPSVAFWINRILGIFQEYSEHLYFSPFSTTLSLGIGLIG